MKDKLEQIFNKHHEGFSVFDKDEIIKELLILYNVSNSVCDHKVRTADGMVVTFRNTCEICGKNMRAK